MDVFVTGGSGFVGSHLIQRLVSRGDTVSALSRSERSDATIAALGAVPIRGALGEPDRYRATLSHCPAVVHTAGVVSVWGQEQAQRDANVDGTGALVAAARDAGVESFVHIGAASVELNAPGQQQNSDQDEPYGLYSQTKLRGEQQVLAAHRDGFRSIVLRPPAIWGTGDMGVLPEIVEAVRKHQFVWINNGGYHYDVCHVENLCECILLAIDHPSATGIFPVRDSERYSFREFVEGLLRSQDVQCPRLSVPLTLAWWNAGLLEQLWRLLRLQSRPPITRMMLALIGQPIVVDDTRARTELGYSGRFSRADGLAGLRENQGYWKT